MKKLVCLLAALAATGFAMPAAAESYGALIFQSKTMQFSGVPTGLAGGLSDAKLTELGGKYGYQFNKNFALEMDLTFGIGDDTIHTSPDLKVKTDASAFAYGVVTLPLNEKFSLLARAGYGHQSGQASGAGGSVDTNDGAFTYGGGLQYMVNAKNGVRADYTIFQIPDVDTSSIGVSYIHKF